MIGTTTLSTDHTDPYTPHPTHSNSNKTWEARNFSIITGPTADLAQACGLLNPEESLFMSTATPEYYKGA